MPFPWPSLSILAALLTAAALFDLRFRRIPNALTVAVAASGFFSQLLSHGLRAAGSGLAAMLLTIAVLGLAWRKGLLGGGDLKLAAAAATWSGLDDLVFFLLAAALLGGLLSLACYAGSSRSARDDIRLNLVEAGAGGRLRTVPVRAPGRLTVPYGIAISAGLAIALSMGG